MCLWCICSPFSFNLSDYRFVISLVTVFTKSCSKKPEHQLASAPTAQMSLKSQYMCHTLNDLLSWWVIWMWLLKGSLTRQSWLLGCNETQPLYHNLYISCNFHQLAIQMYHYICCVGLSTWLFIHVYVVEAVRRDFLSFPRVGMLN